VDPRSLVAADFNGDGALDLAVANDHSNDVSVLLNRNDGAGTRRVAAPRSSDVVAHAIRPAAVDALFAGSRSELLPPVVGQQAAVAAVDAVFAANRPEVVTAPPAEQAVAEAGIIHHQHKEDRAGAADAAGLADLLVADLAVV